MFSSLSSAILPISEGFLWPLSVFLFKEMLLKSLLVCALLICQCSMKESHGGGVGCCSCWHRWTCGRSSCVTWSWVRRWAELNSACRCTAMLHCTCRTASLKWCRSGRISSRWVVTLIQSQWLLGWNLLWSLSCSLASNLPQFVVLLIFCDDTAVCFLLSLW